MLQFLDSIISVKNNYKKYDTWEQDQEDDIAKRKYLAEKLDLPKDKVALTKQKAEAVFRASDILDRHSEDNAQNSERSFGLLQIAILTPIAVLTLFPLAKMHKNFQKKINEIPGELRKKGHITGEFINNEILKETAKFNKKINLYNIALIGIPAAIGIGMSVWGASQQKEASRIGRFQGRQTDLKDEKNFVLYTPEQIEAAKKLAQNMPDKKDDKGIIQSFKDLKQMFNDKKAYKEYLKQRGNNEDEIKQILNADYTPEQLAQGEEDKEIIVNIVKDVNMKAETYSENVENLFDTLGMGSAILGFGLGIVVNSLLSKIKTLGSKERKYTAIAVGALTPLSILLWSTKAKKEASRVGRYTKRQEILDNPELIMSYSKEQMDSAKDVKGEKLKKGFFADFKDNYKFLSQYLKDSKKYNTYKNKQAKEDVKLYDALKQVEVTSEQIKQAKNLQEKTFRTFDKIDEYSQRYSEDMEAATEITKQVVNLAIDAAIIAAPLLAGKAVTSGKLPIQNIINFASKILLKPKAPLRNLIENAHKIINNTPELKKDLGKAILKPELLNKYTNHPKLKTIFKKFIDELGLLKNIGDNEVLNNNFKQDFIFKWIRNLALDSTKLFGRMKAKKELEINGIKNIPEEFNLFKKGKNIFENFKNYFNEYKTLNKTILFGGVPFIAIFASIPWAISSYFTNLQLKAGRIGVMKAMQDLDNPKLFINNDNIQNDETNKA